MVSHHAALIHQHTWIENLGILNVSQSVSPGDRMFKPDKPGHYFSVGRSALLAIRTALSARLANDGGDKLIETILDYGCGHGRVARYLRAAFPDSVISVSDIDRPGVEWCIEQLGCTDMGQAIPSSAFDIVWLGSVFTHLNESAAADLLIRLKRAVRDNGILIFTSGGRYRATKAKIDLERATSTHKPKNYPLDPDTISQMISDYDRAGYGFASYPKKPGYGAAIVNHAWYTNKIVDRDFLQILFQERGWDGNQDVHAFMRTKLLGTKKGAWSQADAIPAS